MKLFFITNSTELAEFATKNGADRIFVDLEIHGKELRQGHLDTVISRHTLSDVSKLRPFVPKGGLLVRINPLHADTRTEIDQIVQAGADIIMLPMFHGPREVQEFVRLVAGRTRTLLLAETIGAMQTLNECVSISGVDEVHIGLNDLHLELGNRFMFEPLANGLVDTMAAVLNRAKIPFGIGGVARVGEGHLPAEMILSEHARLGSTAAILSRTFHRQAKTVAEIQSTMDFKSEISKLQLAYLNHRGSDSTILQATKVELDKRIRQIAAVLQPKVIL